MLNSARGLLSEEPIPGARPRRTGLPQPIGIPRKILESFMSKTREFPRLLDDFSPTTPEAWREKVVGDLKGADFDRALAYRTAHGFEAQALYHGGSGSAAAGFPGVAPFTRGFRLPEASPDRPAWEPGLIVDHGHAAEANRRLLKDLGLGARRIWLRLGSAGVRVDGADVMDRLLADVEPSFVKLMVDGAWGDGGDDLERITDLYLGRLARSGQDLSQIEGSLGADPLRRLVESGPVREGLGAAFGRAMALARWCGAEAPGLRVLRIDTTPYHGAGASPSQELALGLGLGVELLRRGEGAGLDPASVASSIDTVFSVGRDLFLEVAKLRAWRRLWAQVLDASGAGSAIARQTLHLLPSQPTQTTVDPWVNMLRATREIFIGAVAGVDSITVAAYADRLGLDSDHGRRVALNAHHVLAEESHLAQVADPAGGSWALDGLTDQLASEAWQLFQDFEQRTADHELGFAQLLVSGHVQGLLRTTLESRRQGFRKRKDAVVGVSMFANLDEQRPQAGVGGWRSDAGEPIEDRAPTGSESSEILEQTYRTASLSAEWASIADGSSAGSAVSCDPLPAFREAVFEALRSLMDFPADASGQRFKILQIQLGTPKEARARAQFAGDFFAVAGLASEVVSFGEDPSAFSEQAEALDPAGSDPNQTVGAVLCSTDERYVDTVPAAARVLKEAGVTRLFLAGRPGERESEWREAGVDDFIFLGCDAYGLLESLVGAALGYGEDE